MKLLIAFLAICSFQTLVADQITLKNGDRVSGTIVKKEAATLTIKSTYFGLVNVPWAEIQSITSDQPLTVVLPDGKTVQGTIATRDGNIVVSAAASPQGIPLAQIEALRDSEQQALYEKLQRPGLIDLWTVSGNLSLAAASGNARTSSLSIPVNASRITRTDKTTLYFNLIRASALVNGVNSATAQAIRGGLGYNRNLGKRLFWNVFNDYEYDRFQNLDLRVVAGSGFGYSTWKSDRGRLDLVGGLAYNRESFDPIRPATAFVRNSAEGYWGNDLAFKLNSRASLLQSYRMFNNLKDSGRFRQNFDLGLTSQLTKWLTWNVSVSDRFLNQPVAGRKKNDVFYATGLGFTFSR